uniref:Rab-GAP TBC domain-containing protein n=1 Tax=Rhizophora mucronata TaxID=61149 RepID=A0A2P2J182_RHIMU
MMHSNIGTGMLAYVVGSKVMDMRTFSKDNREGEASIDGRQVSTDSANKLESYSNWNNNCRDISSACERESSSDSAEIDSVRESTDSPAYDSSFVFPGFGPFNSSFPTKGEEVCGSLYDAESYFDFPALPVTDLFDKRGKYHEEHDKSECCTQWKLRFHNERMHSFEINNNIDLIMESNGEPSSRISYHSSEIEMVHCENSELALSSFNIGYEKQIAKGLRISDVPQTSFIQTSATSEGVPAHDDRVSEWLWTLHRIVVDVVRTDSHLEFYEDKRNLARMSDILAVYAWVDPATGYCQGMSDLLSPFVVLFEDDSDAFWCFEMLLRRMRENFQMEGPTGVMKQLQALWHILELTDREMFAHLSRIGAESLHFAFRMLMVLFRRELSFSEVLQMWEMMWAADFDESTTYDLEKNCLEALILHLPMDSGGEMKEGNRENGSDSSKHGSQTKNGNVEHMTSDNSGVKSSSSSLAFCGLTTNFWPKNDQMQISAVVSSTKNGDDELPVFCAAAVLMINRHKIFREAHSIDDLIKIFNDKLLKIHVKRCVRTAIKLRKKYFYKRENFQMEGPTGVMKQLQALWHILELTDREMFAHLSRIGAESLHFAFRMLMVLFRRELSFSEVLQMWEMMWAADFDESTTYDLEKNCLEALILHLPMDSGGEMKEGNRENGSDSSKHGSQTKNGNVEHMTSDNSGVKSSSSSLAFCGLTTNFWPKNDQMQISAVVSSTKNGDDELPVFCAAAVLMINRHKIFREAHSIDDLIKIFNDKLLKIHVKRCVRTAIKLRKKYFYKLIKSKSPAAQKVD